MSITQEEFNANASKLIALRNRLLMRAATSADPKVRDRYERLLLEKKLRAELKASEKNSRNKALGRLDLVDVSENELRVIEGLHKGFQFVQPSKRKNKKERKRDRAVNLNQKLHPIQSPSNTTTGKHTFKTLDYGSISAPKNKTTVISNTNISEHKEATNLLNPTHMLSFFPNTGSFNQPNSEHTPILAAHAHAPLPPTIFQNDLSYNIASMINAQQFPAFNLNPNTGGYLAYSPPEIAQTSGTLFTAVATSAPPSIFTSKASPIALPSGATKVHAVQTNNFWGNMALGDQTSYVYTHPYVVWYSTTSDYKGLAVAHSTASQRVVGSTDTEGAASYFYMPSGNKSLVLGSSDFSSGVTLELTNMTRFSVDATLKSASEGSMTCSLIQGMGFVTGVYNNLIPEIHSAVGISSVTGDTSPRTGTNKYKILLGDGSTWVMYVNFTKSQTCSFALKNSNHIIGSNSIDGCTIQVACGDYDAYDKAAGCYPTAVTLKGSISGSTGTYSLNYTTSGSSNNGTTVMYALPHHVSSFTSTTSGKKTSSKLDDTIRGSMTAYLTNVFEMSESLPTAIGVDPWTSISGWSKASYTTSQLAAIKTAAGNEYGNDVYTYTDLNSMYTSGKILDKYAYVLYVLHYVVKDTAKTKTLLSMMKKAIERYSKNTQTYPLCYETNWGGICSTGGMDSSDWGIDYGNAFYNDHHFHYGYHIHAAAMVAKVDTELGGTWVSTVKDWVNTLVRDVANPSDSDTYFPIFRSFDFYIGHSFAHGLSVYADGKDEESSSEDYNFSYAMKIWAQVIGDSNMENRANLMLAISKRSMNDYMYYKSDNTVMPSSFIKNYVSGITFENKIDHTTYFGTNLEYIHGIHMLPITPVSSFLRGPDFVKEEWNGVLSGIVGSLTSGWKGILMLNCALYDPATAYSFFSQSNFDTDLLDNGMSLSWSLAYTSATQH
ncbi:glycoside hydrolase family 81 protein [[Candida] arabinofermentans NRRL YB-2248]|uniref:glucan endo-1,3-beta-D-glucosidase n=1 Tax=[Candida] arabinofermentans NRRL YB-2248 TaxID=983967 RepID=A0A1E4T8T8_9ASCO|nr:glycoside hydrolase family 81 protein [[Candida] arabinofermentans NRRL YB-2248]